MTFLLSRRLLLTALCLLAAACCARAADAPLIRTARSGAWSDAATWDGGKLPAAGARVLIRPGHRVVYDRRSDDALRSVHVGGVLTFAGASHPSLWGPWLLTRTRDAVVLRHLPAPP